MLDANLSEGTLRYTRFLSIVLGHMIATKRLACCIFVFPGWVRSAWAQAGKCFVYFSSEIQSILISFSSWISDPSTPGAFQQEARFDPTMLGWVQGYDAVTRTPVPSFLIVQFLADHEYQQVDLTRYKSPVREAEPCPSILARSIVWMHSQCFRI
ncbi:uncharacterized protein K452DRAFT_10612 [Aplosporella prunicola CBS 121167]|uniref:Uncharacterized protein n=1 Tax=Aplosporella prunicola CBS 121167 TaxID=1176127 RepID=A0A6A6BHG6_9PEZI|nr:uncharacterized protein K452DRAFT_10612 [Aplosporella prunicola CBS 121167]KAF2142775.1 hypothetical protein K452DRAFT_10612 [Aplosporella prunicola CBS 121167]